MRNSFFSLLLLAAIAFTASSCRIQAPQFKGIENVQLEKVGFKGVKFGAEAVFHNPNRIRFKLIDLAMNVKLDKKNVGTIGEKADIIIPRRSDFRIPMGVMINPEGTIFDNLITIVELFRDKESVLSLEGDIRVKTLGVVNIPIRFKHEEKIRLSQLRNR